MKTIVIYKSKAGYVKRYAQWIAEELSADLFKASKADVKMLCSYDTVIYGGGLYAVGINGIKFIKQNLDSLKEKKVIVFGTGASPWREEIVDEVRNKNFTEEQQKLMRFFYMRGGFDFGKLKPVDKVLMIMMKRMLKKKKELTPDERGLLASYDHPVDFTNKKNITQLITYANS